MSESNRGLEESVFCGGSAKGLTERAQPQELLRGTPQGVLARLTQGDPLDLAHRVRRYLYSRRFLMDEQRVVLATATLVARNARRYRGRPALDRWIERQIEACVEAQRYDSNGTSARSKEFRGGWAELAERFGLQADALDSACRQFHRLPFESRDAFFRLVLERRPIESLVYEGGRRASEIATEARRALLHFIRLKPNRTKCDGQTGARPGSGAG